MSLRKVVSGGQTGADQAGWRAAAAAGLETGGWMPDGYETEEGPRPEFAELYGARAIPGGSYRDRTRANARESDATFWFGDAESRGGQATLRACREFGKPVWHVEEGALPSSAALWLRVLRVGVLNVAGNRESGSPGIGARAERFLAAVFARCASVVDHQHP